MQKPANSFVAVICNINYPEYEQLWYISDILKNHSPGFLVRYIRILPAKKTGGLTEKGYVG